jgi:hypothetical protein
MPQESKYSKTILCLANSRKLSGRCLAGKEVNENGFGSWIRPVSEREAEEISVEDRRYEDGHVPHVLEKISIPFLRPKPGTFQSENHLIASDFYWRKEGTATWDDCETALDKVSGALWENGHSTYNGTNDQVPEEIAAKFKHSLVLMKPTNLVVSVGIEGGVFGPAKRKVRANFNLNQMPYSLSLTDALIEKKYLQGANGSYPVKKAILCVSLGEVFKGNAYKLAAAMITPDRNEKE